jgi:hypothetical protein
MMSDQVSPINLQSGSSFSKSTSILLQITDKSITNITGLALLGCVFWFATMLFYFVNDLLVQPLDSIWIFLTAAVLNILSTLYLFFFAQFLNNNQKFTEFNNIFTIFFIGCLVRFIARISDFFIELFFQLEMENPVDKTLYFISDIAHILGFLAISVFLLFLFVKERKMYYKLISMISFIFSVGLLICNVFILLFDFGMISELNVQITRFISILASLPFILYFTELLWDSRKIVNVSANTIDS